MKIHKILIKNIASLKGAHVLDFEDIQMERGSFAITGDTGAGKSTILNCVSLALYGKSYKGLNQGDFVTLGESSGRVELVFSSGSSTYLSIWACRVRKKNGEYLKTPSHTKEFYRFLGSEKEILDASPEDVIHLSFDQFCKTVILNQGEFAKFLTSSFRERKDILEKLYEGDKLDVFNPLLREKISSYASKADKIEARIKGLAENFQESVNPEGLEELARRTQRKTLSLEEMRKAFMALKEISENNQALTTTAGRLEDITKKLAIHIEKLNGVSKEKEEFEKSHQIFLRRKNEVSPALHQAVEWNKRLGQIKKENETKRIEIERLKKSLGQAKEDFDRLSKTLRTYENELAALEEGHLLKNIDEKAFETLQKAFSQSREANNKIVSMKEFVEHLKESIKELNSKKTNSYEEIKSLEKRKEELAKNQDLGSNEDCDKILQEVRKADHSLESLLREEEKLQKSLDTNKKDLLASQKKLAEAKSLYEKKTEMARDFKLAISTAQSAMARYLCLKESLEKETCVVCDNTDLKQVKSKASSEDQLDVSRLEKNLEDVLKEQETCFQNAQRESASHSSLIAEKERLLQAIKAGRADFTARNLEILSRAGISTVNFDGQKILSGLRNEKKSLEERLATTRRIHEEIIQIDTRLSSLKESLASLEEKAVELEGRFRETEAQMDLERKAFDKANESVISILGFHNAHEVTSFIQKRDSWGKLKAKQSLAQRDSFHLKEKERSLQDNLKNVSEAADRLASEGKDLSVKIRKTCEGRSPEEALEELEKEAHVLEMKKKGHENQLKELELEKSGLFARIQTLEEQLKDQENMSLSLWGAYRASFASDELYENLELKNLLTKLSKTDKPPEGENLRMALDLAERETAEKMEELEAEKERLAQYKAILKQQEAAREQIEALTKELRKNNSQREQWEELYLLIGKDEFRNYVLAMVEKILIQQTNAELAKLCDGRYLIQHKQSSSRLAPDFYIIDKFRGDETRKVSTLSGGETFMVSLAMALALAELTRGSADIDSFFIDEGFGTLDKDSLEEALEMLQDIELRGKQIGLISHVKELTNRIPVNIHLQKNRLGNSSIEIVYN